MQVWGCRMDLDIHLVEKATSEMLLALPVSREFNWEMFGIYTITF